MAQTIKLKRSSIAGRAPTVNDLELGEVAINTYDGKMYIKKDVSGTETIVEVGGETDAQTAIWKEYAYTATSGQTTFVGADDNSETLTYLPGFIQVFLNGVLLDPATDYTATSGASVVLTSGANLNDLLQIASFVKVLGSGDQVTDEFTGDNSTAAFTLSANPDNENNTIVFIDGVYQEKATYSVSGTTLTFSTAPYTGASIEVIIASRNVTVQGVDGLTLNRIQFNTDQTGSTATGQVAWNTDTGTLELGLNADVNLEVGEQNYFQVKAAESISKGDVLYASGAVGNSSKVEVSKYIANNTIEEQRIIGLAAQDMALNDFGFAISFGTLRGLQTDGQNLTTPETWVLGDILYASAAVAGELTRTRPSAPNQAVPIAFITAVNSSAGSLVVRAYELGSHLDEIHDVEITSIADNDLLQWNTSASRWENVAGTTSNIAEGTNLYWTTARGDSNFATNLAASDTDDLSEGATNLYYTSARANANFDTRLAAKSTTDLAEGTNLYYTSTRFDTAFSAKTTDNLSEGATNLYYTSARANTDFDTRLATKTTDNLSEGTTNLYYTDARVGSYLTANSYATQTYVSTAISNLVDSAPATLDTLNELAAALGDDPNFATTVTNSIAGKVSKTGDTMTGNLTVPSLIADDITYNGGTGDATSLSTTNFSSLLDAGSKAFQIIGGSFTAKNTSNNPWIDASDSGVTLYNGANISSGNFQIAGTTVIDSGRAISAASMTTSGAVGVGGNLDVDGIIDNTRNNSSVAAPSLSDHTAGTRIKFFDSSASAFYAMGIESATLWFHSDSQYKFYVDGALRVDISGSGVVNAAGGYKVGSTEIINSSGSVVGAPTIALATNGTDTAEHRIAVYDSGSVSYGMMLWNDNGSAGDWGTMIYGPNQSNRTISFGKIIDSTFTNHGDVIQIAYFDLDNGNFVHKGQTGYDTTIRAYGQGSSDDALLQLLGQGNNPSQEGFEIWYDNDVGEVSLSTTFPNAAADMHFRTGTGASKSTSNTRLTLHGDGNATLYANPNSVASFQSIPSSAGYNYINIAGTDGNDSGIIFSEGDGNAVTNRRMMIGYDASEDFLRFYTYYRSDGTTAVNSNRAEIDTYGNLNIGGAYQMDGSTIINSNREIDSSRDVTTGHISTFKNTNTGTAAYSEIWVQNGTTADRLVLGYSKNYSASEWSGKAWVYSATGPLALKTPSTLQIYSGGLDDNYISATYDSSGNYSHLRGNASFDNQVKIKAASHPSASGTALTVGDNASEGLRFGSRGHLLSADTHLSHNHYYTGSGWAHIDGSNPSSTIKMGSATTADISFGFTEAGVPGTIDYAYEFPKSGKARFDTSLTIGGDDIGTRNGLSVTSAGTTESQAVFQSSIYSAAFGILSHDNVTYLSQNIYYDGGAWVQDSYSGEQRNALLAIRTQGSGHGVYWYASTNGTASWDIATNVQLFNGYGYCTADITTNNFRSTAPHFLTSETLELGDYGSSWGHPYISMASGWSTGAYPTIGSTGGSIGPLIMLHNPHIPFRTDNAASGQTGRAGIRCAIDTNATTYYDVGAYQMTGVTEGFQIARGGIRYMYTTGDDNFIFADNIYVDNGNLRIGDQAFSQSADYVGMKTAFQSGSSDYMIISGLTDGNTYISAKSAQSVIIRGGGNLSSNQIRVDTTTITATTSNFISSGNVTAYSDERLKSDIQTLDGAKVLAMRGVSFTKDGEAGSGVIAQELEKVAPELVHTADDEMGTKSVAYGNLVGYLIEAVKMQQQQINELKALIKENKNGND